MKMDKGVALVLLSGGLDSATAAYEMKKRGHTLMALSFDYRQRHNIELLHARKIAKALEIQTHFVIGVGGANDWGKSALTNTEVPVPEHDLRDIGNSGGIPDTYVPGRNTIFLAYALGIAQSHHIPIITTGFNVVDYSGYPDCRAQYVEMWNRLINTLYTPKELRPLIHAPLIFMRKVDIIKRGIELKVPHRLTWSCYDPQWNEDKTTYTICNKCDSCKLRKIAFEEAGSTDPAISKVFKFENV
jgi:7-cyano-7-deazaguanine synthase